MICSHLLKESLTENFSFLCSTHVYLRYSKAVTLTYSVKNYSVKFYKIHSKNTCHGEFLLLTLKKGDSMVDLLL